MVTVLGLRWSIVAIGMAILLVFAAACTKTVEVPGETVVVEKEVVKTVEVPGETVVVEKIVEKLVEKIVIATPTPGDGVFAMTTLDPNNKRGGTFVVSNQGPPGHFDHYAGGSVVWQGWMGTMYDNLLRQDLRSAGRTDLDAEHVSERAPEVSRQSPHVTVKRST